MEGGYLLSDRSSQPKRNEKCTADNQLQRSILFIVTHWLFYGLFSLKKLNIQGPVCFFLKKKL
jgi:hypothetical protein